MNQLFINIVLFICAVICVTCICINISIYLYYVITKDGFLRRSFMTFDYVSLTDEMTPRHRKLYLVTLIGMFIFFIPGGYFIGSILHKYLR